MVVWVRETVDRFDKLTSRHGSAPGTSDSDISTHYSRIRKIGKVGGA